MRHNVVVVWCECLLVDVGLHRVQLQNITADLTLRLHLYGDANFMVVRLLTSHTGGVHTPYFRSLAVTPPKIVTDYVLVTGHADTIRTRNIAMGLLDRPWTSV